MNDKEALEHILGTADEVIKVFGDIPVDSIEHMARHAGRHIVSMVAAAAQNSNPGDQVMIYATAIAGLIIKLKADVYARGLLAVEEASDDS